MKRLLILFLILGVLLGGLYSFGQRQSQDTADLIFVFGAPAKEGQPSKTLENRCARAADYLMEHPSSRAILLGGRQKKTDAFSEAQIMAKDLMLRGIEEDRLILEEISTSTWTNLLQAKAIMERRFGLQPVMVCSSDYHMLRIAFLAKRLDLKVYPLPAPTPGNAMIFSYFREVLALVKSFLIDR